VELTLYRGTSCGASPRGVSSFKEERPGLTVRWGLLTQSPLQAIAGTKGRAGSAMYMV